MGVQGAGLYGRDGRMRQDMDLWAIYAAQADTGDFGLVKVGVSSSPLKRAFGIHGNSPFPLERFVWSWAGERKATYQLEAFIHRAFKARKTRGEWFRFDFGSDEDKRFFNSTIRQAYQAVIGKPLTWTVVDLAEIRAYAVQMDRVKRQHTVRRLDFRSRSRRP